MIWLFLFFTFRPEKACFTRKPKVHLPRIYADLLECPFQDYLVRVFGLWTEFISFLDAANPFPCEILLRRGLYPARSSTF